MLLLAVILYHVHSTMVTIVDETTVVSTRFTENNLDLCCTIIY